MADGVLQREELPGTKIMPYVLGVGYKLGRVGFGPRVGV